MLKVGTQTGSLVNHLYSRATKGAPDPEVGMGATLLHWTDRSPATIVAVTNIRGTAYITVQEDNAKRIDTNGMSEDQEYEYTPNPVAYKHVFRRAKDGGWESVRINPETNRWKKTGGDGLIIGFRRKYHDFSF